MSPPQPPFSPTNPYAAVDAAREARQAQRIPGRTIQFLSQSRIWLLLISILSFLLSVVFGLSCFAYLNMLVSLKGSTLELTETAPIVKTLMLAIAVTFFLFASAVLLWRYAGTIREFVRFPSSRNLNSALTAQRNFWTIGGVLLLITFAIQLYSMLGQLMAGWADMT